MWFWFAVIIIIKIWFLQSRVFFNILCKSNCKSSKFLSFLLHNYLLFILYIIRILIFNGFLKLYKSSSCCTCLRFVKISNQILLYNNKKICVCLNISWLFANLNHNLQDPRSDSKSHYNFEQFLAVLPEPHHQHEYINSSLSSPTPIFNSAKADLEQMSLANSRYPDTSAYYPNNWGTPSSSYPNNYNYYGPPNNNQQYLNPNGTPTMVLYPHLYSTVNQNSIHLHLHSNADKGGGDQYVNFNDGLTFPSSRPPEELEQDTTVNSTEGEVVPSPHEHIENLDRTQVSVTDPSSVWRPYWRPSPRIPQLAERWEVVGVASSLIQSSFVKGWLDSTRGVFGGIWRRFELSGWRFVQREVTQTNWVRKDLRLVFQFTNHAVRNVL